MEWAFKLAHPYLLYPDPSLTVGFILASLLHVTLCFVLLGITASEYLCPNVAKLADYNGHGTGTLMAVLLSWCNSSPDLFSNFMSWTSTNTTSSSSNGAALSVGEVLGACGIILCIVEGSIFIIMSSTPLSLTPNQKRHVLRDLAFTLVAILLMWYVCIRNRVTVLNCLAMIAIYSLYIVFKFTWNNTSSQDDYESNEEIVPEFTRQALPIDGGTIVSGIKPSLISAMDFNNLFSMLESSRSPSQDNQEELMSLNGQNISLEFEQQVRPFTEPSRERTFTEVPTLPQSSPAAFVPYHDNPEQTQEPEIFPSQFTRSRNKGKLKKFKKGLLQLFVPHLLHFRQKSFIDAVLSILTVPFVIFLRFACPQPTNILDYDEGLGKYILSNVDIVLLFVQSALCPFISFMTLSCILAANLPSAVWILAVLIFLSLLSLTLAFYKTLISFNRFSLIEPSLEFRSESDESSDERRMLEKLGNVIIMIYLSLGVINAILCISLIANSLIEMLEIYQKMTQISQAILGLTIFAWGNSISDLISNIAMCRLYRKMPQNEGQDMHRIATKFFMISCTSCIGGVLLNSMGGIGISGLVSMIFVHKSSSKWAIMRSVELYGNDHAFDFKFIISCIAIVFQIVLLAVFFGAPQSVHDWCKDRMKYIGLAMCCIWGMATACNVLIELYS